MLSEEKLYAKPKEVIGDGRRTKIITEYRQAGMRMGMGTM